MNKRSPTSIDGFIPRRPGAQIGSLHETEKEEPIDRSLHTSDNNIARGVVGVPRQNISIGRSDIDESLRDIDNQGLQDDVGRRAQKKRDKKAGKKPQK